MDIIFASSNEGKIREFREILKPYGINVLSLHDLGFTGDIIEDGETFLDNAIIKAKTISKLYNKPAMSDDSGICVCALNNAPGVHSARYSPNRDDKENNKLLLKNLGDNKNRKAFYECDIVIYFPDDRYYSYVGKCFGKIAYEETGNLGFGYDPLFIPDGYEISFGLIPSEEKNKISHRGNAIREMLKDINKIF
ncbi:MAG: RdgB/HAM1 family non-canonical purine NTP pyrophosphatase [Acholeplasmatales bacterium]|nr:RdgB/HAM1 family non-canonical purine NTP pyrophosphatase [Acholeplasmatales bacterium]